MYAIVDIAGEQCRVEKGDILKIPKLESDVGEQVDFTQVLLVSQGEGNLALGRPVVDHAKVVGKILGHGRAKKVLVFKKKRRKEYKKLNGHRQNYTEVMIEDIVTEGVK